jgi:hypothetical protein
MFIAREADRRRFVDMTAAFDMQDRPALKGGGKMFQRYAYSRGVRSGL